MQVQAQAQAMMAQAKAQAVVTQAQAAMQAQAIHSPCIFVHAHDSRSLQETHHKAA